MFSQARRISDITQIVEGNFSKPLNEEGRPRDEYPLDELVKNPKKAHLVEVLSGDAGMIQLASHAAAFLNSGGGTVIMRGDGWDVKFLDKELRSLISPKSLFSVAKQTRR